MQEQPASVGGRPAVGNVLGFSLLLRDRQALLHLERRALAPGLRLIDYEAEVPDVEFPLRAQGAAAFRRRRCLVHRLRLEVEARALEQWVRLRLSGSSLAGLRIDEVDLDLVGRVDASLAPSPCLYLSGHRDGRPGWVMLSLQVVPRGRTIAVRPWRTWRIDEGAPDPSTLWRELAVRLGGAAEPELPDAFVFDPVRPVLLGPFVGAGWRVPDLGDLAVRELAFESDRAELSLTRSREDDQPQRVPTLDAPDPVSEHLERVEQARLAGRTAIAAAELERLTDVLPPEHPARLAALRWLARIGRRHDPALARRALRAWLHLRPRDDEAARALVVTLGRAGNDRALAKRLAAQCRLPHPPLRQARLELALAVVLTDRLEDPASGKGLLEPLLERCAEDPRLSPVELPARVCYARTLAAESPPDALAELPLALALTERSATRASVQLAIGEALTQHGHYDAALPVLVEAAQTVPEDPVTIDAALLSARFAGRSDRIIELSRMAVVHASPEMIGARRRALVMSLLERGDDASRGEAQAVLREVVGDAPSDRDLGQLLSQLEREGGPPQRAAELIDAFIGRASHDAPAEPAAAEPATTDEPDADPRPALRERAESAADDQPEPWRALAEAHARFEDPQGETEARLELALRLLGRGDLSGARQGLARARRLRPRNREISLALGFVELRAGDPEEAAARFASALGDPSAFSSELLRDPRLGLPPSPEEIRAQVGQVMLRADRPREAIELLRPAVAQLDPSADPSRAESLFDALVAAEEHREASTIARRLADAHEGSVRGHWLAKAAEHASPEDALAWLREAADLCPDDGPMLTALERAADAAGDEAERRAVWHRMVAHPKLPDQERTRVLRALMALESTDGAPDDGQTALGETALERAADDDDDDTHALLVLARRARADQDLDRARALERRAWSQLPADDPRRSELALSLARADLDQGDATGATQRLLPLVGPEASETTLELLAEAAPQATDPELRLAARRALVEHLEPGPARTDAELQLACELSQQGHPHEALHHAEAATQVSSPGTPIHVTAAQVWLSLADDADDAQQQAAAREQLRMSLGPELASTDLRAEAVLLAERLDQPERALRLVEEGLRTRPADATLLSTLKDLAPPHGDPGPYLRALEAALGSVPPGEDRDRIATDLALVAAEAGDATLAHHALEQLSAAARNTELLLELWDWTIRTLGLEGEELELIDQQLRVGPIGPELIHRLSRRVGEGEPTVEHLLSRAREAEPETAHAIIEPTAELAERAAPPRLWMRVLEHALRIGAHAVVEASWPRLVERVADGDDEGLLADLVSTADDARDAGVDIDDRIVRLFDQTLAERPSSRHLHRALARRLARHTREPTAREAEIIAHLDAIADRFELASKHRAELFVGMAERLDRRAAAEVLTARAERVLDDPAAFGRLIRALEAAQCWPEVLGLLGSRVEHIDDVDDKVTTLKHLAHVAAEVLGDSAAAVRHLEAALELSPTDPDLLLPLLDHHFSQTDLSRAVDLTERVLHHVRMGDAAFAALAHRAADAAIAQDEAERAVTLLERVTERVPDDTKARARIEELRGRANDPNQRVVLLASVASRQSGKARIEALEERARLLLDPLERPTEAIEDLEAVVAESPQREASATLLAELYREHGRFEKLVALYEAELPRRHGEARARVLQRIAHIHRDELYDLPRAEQALRLAIDQLDASPRQRDLADDLREELIANLERQGRFVDLAVYLEQELEPELAAPPDAAAAPPGPRLALLNTLARLLRDRIGDEDGAARIYERLERWDALCDDGLATLARWYRRTQRYADLVRALRLRARALAGHAERRAAVDMRIAELLDGPLSRPQDAAPHYLDAFLFDPETYAAAGARARVLLSAVDSVTNVRTRLRQRLAELDIPRRPPLLTLLADVLAPHDSYEEEAEACYHRALEIDPQLASAHEGLGRLLSRGGKHDAAAQALVAAIDHGGLPPGRAAEASALAARNLIELERYPEAEAVLRKVLADAPSSARVLLELARLYERSDRRNELSQVLDRLARLPLSSTMLADIAYRRAMLLESVYAVVPNGPQGERARGLLLEALGIDPRHGPARRAMLELATARDDWSIVAHMHYLSIRELPPGAQRATVHLDLAATYLDHLEDPKSAMRNIESALQQAATDVVIANRTAELARRMPEPRIAAQRFEAIASDDNELDDATRARLWLLAADLRMEDDDRDAAEAASRRVLDLPSVPRDASAAATRTLERLTPIDPLHLAELGSGVVARLDEQPPPAPHQRAELLGRLHDIGVALNDPALVARASREQLELAADLDDDDDDADTTSALLRDLLTARGEYGPVVELYQRLAAQAGGADPVRAAAVLVEAAGFAWRGQREPASAASLLARALRLRPNDEAALSTLRELILETSDPAAAENIEQALDGPDGPAPSPALSLLRASLATTRGAEQEALTLLRPLTGPEIPGPVRFEAMGRLERLLADRGEQDERRRLLGDFFSLARERADPRVGDLGLELARLQVAAGDRAAARRTGERALERAPEHSGLLHLLAELSELDEDWEPLVAYYEQLARLAVDETDQATWLTRAAQLYRAHPALTPGEDAELVARRLLLQACEVAPRSAPPRIALLSHTFHQARWEETLERGEELMDLVGHDEEVLVLAALAEAYHHGERRLARDIGYRHSSEVSRQLLLPGLQQILGEVASRGPLPRLDAILGAGSSLTGGRRLLFDSLHAWASERPPEAGLSLGLARLFEARGAGDMARHHYQLAAFMAMQGPVPALVSRLPVVRPEAHDMHQTSTAPMEGRSALREVLASLRDHLAGIGNEGAPAPAPPHMPAPSWWQPRMEHAETIVEPWRAILGVDLPLAWTDAPLRGGVAVRNDRPPRVLLGRECAALDEAELTFRLATATATIALGTTVLEAGSLDLDVLLDALAQLANPGHRPTGMRAQLMADVLAARDARNIGLTTGQRASLANEIAHWMTTEDGLARLANSLHRARLLLATRMCGRLDGALLTIARDHGLVHEGRVDTTATLRQDDTTWLLRALLVR